MPVHVEGKKIIENSTGKVKGVAKSHKAALISASIRNRAHKEKMEKREDKKS